ncbi:MAG: hypothetical protein J3K34DRAFT_518019, partial [Monoraphidium minutum]
APPHPPAGRQRSRPTTGPTNPAISPGTWRPCRSHPLKRAAWRAPPQRTRRGHLARRPANWLWSASSATWACAPCSTTPRDRAREGPWRAHAPALQGAQARRGGRRVRALLPAGDLWAVCLRLQQPELRRRVGRLLRRAVRRDGPHGSAPEPGDPLHPVHGVRHQEEPEHVPAPRVRQARHPPGVSGARRQLPLHRGRLTTLF